MIFGPKTIAERDSKFSGRLKVVSTLGYRYIATGILTQSGGLVKEVWADTLRKYGRKGKSWLVLGLAGGTIAKFVSDRLAPETIIGVEIDPDMIELGKMYLDLNHIPQLEIVQKDAKLFVKSCHRNFDYILVDMYLGDKLPDFVYDVAFLLRLSKLGRVIIFNHLFYDPDKREKAADLVGKLKQLFPSVVLSRKLTNLLVICSPKAI